MWGVDWSRDGTRVVCAGWGQTVRVWDVPGGEESVDIPNAGERFVRAVAFSPNGEMIAAGGNGPTKLFDAKTRQEIGSFPEVMCPSFLPSGDRIAGWTHAAGLVTLCDVPSGQVRPWRAHTCPIEGLSVSPDGRFIASLGKDGKVKVWYLGTDWPFEVATLRGHRGSVYSAAFTPDGARLLTAGIEDCAVRVWDLPAFCRVRKP
jgi:WD40 repeat protein